MSLEILCSDSRLSGCVSFAAITSSSPVVFCADANRKLVSTFTNGSGSLKWQSDGAVQANAPTCVFSDGTFMHAIGSSLWLRINSSNVVAAQGTPAQLSSPAWGFATSASVLVVPYNSVGVQTMNATTGTVVGILPDVTSRITLAVGGGGYIYCLNQDRATGTTLTVAASGDLGLAANTRWSVPNGHIIRGALVDGATLVVVTDHRVLLFSLADPTTPAFVSSTTLTQTIRGVALIVSGYYWVATDETIPAQNQYFNFPTSAALSANGVLISFSAALGAAENTPTPYTYQGVSVPIATVATPAISPAAGSHTTGQTITITDATLGATIHYTIDGSTPTSASPTYSGGFLVSVGTTVKAIGTLAAYLDSAVASSAYTFVSATPVILPATGSFTGIQTVTITAGAGATIYYTTDGSTPTTSSAVYSGFTVNTTTTVKAVAVEPGKTVSAVATSTLTITLAVNGVTLNGVIEGAAVIGNVVYVGGQFTSVHDASGTLTRNRLAAVDLTTGLFTSWNPNSNDRVECVYADYLGRLWVGGQFTTIGASSRPYLARFNTSQALDSFASGITTASRVEDIVVDPSTGNAFAFGDVNQIGGVTHNIGVWNSSDVFQTSSPGSVPFSGRCLALFNGNLYAAGNAGSIAVYNATTFASVTITAAINNTVENFLVAGGKLYFCGDFTSVLATTRNKYAAIDSTLPTPVLQTWNPNGNSTAWNQAVDANGVFYVFGDFTTIGGTARLGAAAVDSAGALKTTWNASLTAGADVRGGIVLGTSVIMYGAFTNPSAGTNLYVTPIA